MTKKKELKELKPYMPKADPSPSDADKPITLISMHWYKIKVLLYINHVFMSALLFCKEPIKGPLRRTARVLGEH